MIQKALEDAFNLAKQEKFFIELVAIEPIQGEGQSRIMRQGNFTTRLEN